MKLDQLKELILQSFEHEKGGVKIYETALKCVTTLICERIGKSTWNRPATTLKFSLPYARRSV